MKEAPMTISADAKLYDTLPTLYEFVERHVEHYAPNSLFDDAIGRVECETLQTLIDALDLLIALPPAIEKGRG